MPVESIEEASVVPARYNAWSSTPLRVLALVLLLTAAPLYEALSLASFSNADMWWHLRTGLWMLQNHSFPHSGLFSQYADRPWVASSWGFDLLAAAMYRMLGLKAFPVLLMVFKFAIAAVTFLLAGGWRKNFWSAVLLSAAAQYAIVDLQPLPILFSILFFGVELILLLHSRRSGDPRPLFWLPLLFLLWANLHMQFVNGLLLLGLFLLAEIAERWLRSSGLLPSAAASSLGRYSLAKIFAIAGLSVLATLLTPYSFQLIPNAFSTVYGQVLFTNFAEMYSLAFRRPQDFVLLSLAMGAFLALGRQRSRDLFKLSVMSIFVMLALRVQRDVWCVALPAIAVIADALADRQDAAGSRNSPVWKWERPAVAVLVLALFVTAAVRVPGSDLLMRRASRVLPAKACDFIRDNQLPGPLFNSFSWGGFLTWYLPEYPVAIDGRLNLYGDEINTRYFKVMDGTERLETDPSFTRAQTILLERNSGLTKALTTLPALRRQFRVVYQDDLATVLVRQ